MANSIRRRVEGLRNSNPKIQEIRAKDLYKNKKQKKKAHTKRIYIGDDAPKKIALCLGMNIVIL